MAMWKAHVDDSSKNVTSDEYNVCWDNQNIGIYCLKIPSEYNKNGYFDVTATFNAPNAPDNIHCEIQSGIIQDGQKDICDYTIMIGYFLGTQNRFTPGMTETAKNNRTFQLNHGFETYLFLHFFEPVDPITANELQSGTKMYKYPGKHWDVTLDFVFHNEDTIRLEQEKLKAQKTLEDQAKQADQLQLKTQPKRGRPKKDQSKIVQAKKTQPKKVQIKKAQVKKPEPKKSRPKSSTKSPKTASNLEDFDNLDELKIQGLKSLCTKYNIATNKCHFRNDYVEQILKFKE